VKLLNWFAQEKGLKLEWEEFLQRKRHTSSPRIKNTNELCQPQNAIFCLVSFVYRLRLQILQGISKPSVTMRG
jgi:hypothetical protein